MSTAAANRSGGLRLVEQGEGAVADFLLVLLAWVTAAAVAGSNWIPGSQAIVPEAVLGAILVAILARLAPRGLTYWLVVETAVVLVLFVAASRHGGGNIAVEFRTWVLYVTQDANAGLLAAMVAATWLAVAWAGYWALRRGRVAVGLLPMAVVLPVEVINDPSQTSNSFLVVAWIVFAVLLMLRHTVVRVGRRWGDAAAPELSSRVGIHGGRALILMLVAASLIPRLNANDLTVHLFSGTSPTGGNGGAQLVRQLPGRGQFALTGYSERVQPGGTLNRSAAAVMEVTSDFSRTTYLRGIDLYADSNGTWEPGSWVSNLVNVTAGQTLAVDPYLARHTVHATIKVLASQESTIFWPGDPLFASIPTQVRGWIGSGLASPLPVGSVDGAYVERGSIPAGASYTVDSSVSVATEDQLRTAGTDYPPEVVRVIPGLRLNTTGKPVAGAPAAGGPATIDPSIIALTARVVAGQQTPYDQAKAIETYLRTQLKYNLQVTPPPHGQDPVLYFLFNSRVGYCEYFASAMGEMVRGLGIPVRLVSGYGPGDSEAPQDVPRARAGALPPVPNLVKASDAHTWVEVFFPRYGWVPFEPTPDPVYPTLARQPFDPTVDAFPAVINASPAVVPQPAAPATRRASAGSDFGRLIPGLAAGTAGALVLLALAGLLLARGPRRLKSPETAWRRLGWLGARLGRRRLRSQTPTEFARQLAVALPAVGGAIEDLGRAYSQWCYRPAGLAEQDHARADRAWRDLRRALARELVWPRRATPAA